MHMKCSIISPWLVSELIGVQWVEPLPQASYRQVYRWAERWAVVLAIVEMAGVLGHLTYKTLLSHQCTPYYTSALSGKAWVQKLLSGHPEHIWNELGVYQGTFVILIKAFQMLSI